LPLLQLKQQLLLLLLLLSHQAGVTSSSQLHLPRSQPYTSLQTDSSACCGRPTHCCCLRALVHLLCLLDLHVHSLC
jgi:hypothetical protein